MIVAGARCDKCGRVDTIPYTSDTTVQVLLRQKGWVFNGRKCMCQVCNIKYNTGKKS